MLEDNIRFLGNLNVNVERVLSAGSCTKEWLEKTFTEPVNAVYVSANPWVSIVFKGKNVFKRVIDVSVKFWDNKLKTVRAEHVNLIALRYLLRGENLIVHYLQPHAPFICSTWLRDYGDDPTLAGSSIYKQATRSSKARKEFARAYLENLRYVLKVAKKLIYSAMKLGYSIAITSDHSELLGVYAPLKTFKLYFRKNLLKFLKNWLPYGIGYYRVVGHPCGWGDKSLLEVPWVEVYNHDIQIMSGLNRNSSII